MLLVNCCATQFKACPFSWYLACSTRGVQHESHNDKVVGIAATAFEQVRYDMTKGGKAHLVPASEFTRRTDIFNTQR